MVIINEIEPDNDETGRVASSDSAVEKEFAKMKVVNSSGSDEICGENACDARHVACSEITNALIRSSTVDRANWAELNWDIVEKIFKTCDTFSQFSNLLSLCRTWRSCIIRRGQSRYVLENLFFPLMVCYRRPCYSALRSFNQNRQNNGFPSQSSKISSLPEFYKLKDTMLGFRFGQIICGSSKSPKFMTSLCLLDIRSSFKKRKNSPALYGKLFYGDSFYAATIYKHILDPRSYVILLTKDSVLIWKLNDEKFNKRWITLPLHFNIGHSMNGFKQVVVVQEGTLVALDDHDYVYILKVDNSNSCVILEAMFHAKAYQTWLVECVEQIFVVLLKQYKNKSRYKFQVLRWDTDAREFKLIENIDSLGALFVSHNNKVPSFFAQPELWGGVRGCVYFAGDNSKGVLPYNKTVTEPRPIMSEMLGMIQPALYIPPASKFDFWTHPRYIGLTR